MITYLQLNYDTPVLPEYLLSHWVRCVCLQITVFKPFFVSLTLPYSTKRGEEFALQATVFNYLSISLQVHYMSGCNWQLYISASFYMS